MTWVPHIASARLLAVGLRCAAAVSSRETGPLWEERHGERPVNRWRLLNMVSDLCFNDDARPSFVFAAPVRGCKAV